MAAHWLESARPRRVRISVRLRSYRAYVGAPATPQGRSAAENGLFFSKAGAKSDGVVDGREMTGVTAAAGKPQALRST